MHIISSLTTTGKPTTLLTNVYDFLFYDFLSVSLLYITKTTTTTTIPTFPHLHTPSHHTNPSDFLFFNNQQKHSQQLNHVLSFLILADSNQESITATAFDRLSRLPPNMDQYELIKSKPVAKEVLEWVNQSSLEEWHETLGVWTEANFPELVPNNLPF